ncbi:pyridoxamine 5'-phosphate oxidase family protein [Nocardia sp. NPDC060256]|uniref:pyridoxamine 5'-phosphate oxidase family protein n=1 Tax=unclassified Nocardia TaxID=2637762 RepID=UPI00364D46C1
MMDSDERRAFVRENSFCVWGYNRQKHGPAMTIGYYVLDGEDICFLTMAARAKAKAARRDPRASVCVIDMAEPPSYLLLYGSVQVEDDPECVLRIGTEIARIELVREGNLGPDEPLVLDREPTLAWIVAESRVVLRFTPESTFYSPPTRGKSAEEKFEYRASLGAVEAGSIRIGQSLSW